MSGVLGVGVCVLGGEEGGGHQQLMSGGDDGRDLEAVREQKGGRGGRGEQWETCRDKEKNVAWRLVCMCFVCV